VTSGDNRNPLRPLYDAEFAIFPLWRARCVPGVLLPDAIRCDLCNHAMWRWRSGSLALGELRSKPEVSLPHGLPAVCSG